MRKISTRDLSELEVVNICNGEKIGYPTEYEIDLDCGQILSIVVSRCEGFAWFGGRNDIVIKWDKIECVGEDAILVKLAGSECYSCDSKKSRKKR